MLKLPFGGGKGEGLIFIEYSTCVFGVVLLNGVSPIMAPGVGHSQIAHVLT